MLLIGLTGSIGMGKSETAKMFRAEGVPVYDADAAVHKLYEKGGKAVEPIRAAFPSAIIDDAVDRKALSRCVIGLPDEMKKLEAIVHPLVGEAQIDFLRENMEAGHEMAVLDIPLLYETGGETRVDVVVVVSAPYDIQKTRVLARPDMDEAKFAAIHAKQVPDEEKRKRADSVVESDKGLDHARKQVARIVEALKPFRGSGLLPSFPFGSDFTDVEQMLIPALQTVRDASASPFELAKLAARGLFAGGTPDEAALARLGLDTPKSLSDRLYRLLVSAALKG